MGVEIHELTGRVWCSESLVDQEKKIEEKELTKSRIGGRGKREIIGKDEAYRIGKNGIHGSLSN